MPEITSQDVDAYLIGTREKVELKKWEGFKNQTGGKQEKARPKKRPGKGKKAKKQTKN
jgi:hypothetical protein